jgi:site-specific recombinase XerD
MTALAPYLTDFLGNWLPHQKGASPNTCRSYADTFRLLLEFASHELAVDPVKLLLEQIDAGLLERFLRHLELNRGNKPQTRNVRLAALRSFMRFVQYRVPSALEQIRRILAIPSKKVESKLVNHLDGDETDALLQAPDPTTRLGIRDRAMLLLAISAGLRVSELVGLRVDEVSFQPDPTILVRGKGKRTRRLVLWKEAVAALRAWLAVRGEASVPELFLNARANPLSRFGFRYILRKHCQAASRACSALESKTVTPHSLRHTCALNVLQATGDLRKTALWLGHASTATTEVYLRSDPLEKLEILEKLLPPELRRGVFRPSDALIERLRRIGLCGVDYGPIPLSGDDTRSNST